MREKEVLELVNKCFDGDEEKIDAFMKILYELQGILEVDTPTDVKMIIPEETEKACIHETKEKNCLADFPDSIRKCKEPCNYYTSCDSIRKNSMLQ